MFIYLFICFYFIFIHPQDGQMGAFFFFCPVSFELPPYLAALYCCISNVVVLGSRSQYLQLLEGIAGRKGGL